MKFKKPALYLRRDPVMGWHVAFWKWRIAFQVVGALREGKEQSRERKSKS